MEVSTLFKLPEAQEKTWDLKLRGYREVEIAQQLNVSRQAVNKAIRIVKSRLAEMFISISKVLDCDLIKLDVEKGLFVGRIRQNNKRIYGCYVPGYGLIVIFEDIDPKNKESTNVEILFRFASEYFGIKKEKIEQNALKKIIADVFEKI